MKVKMLLTNLIQKLPRTTLLCVLFCGLNFTSYAQTIFGPPIENPFNLNGNLGVSRVNILDIDGDNDLDIFLNSKLHKNIGSQDLPVFSDYEYNNNNSVFQGDLNNDGLLDGIEYIIDSNIDYFFKKNVGSAFDPIFSNQLLFTTADEGPIIWPWYTRLVDIDLDGDLDLAVNGYDSGNEPEDLMSRLFWFENIGNTSQAAFDNNYTTFGTWPTGGIRFDFADLDNDGDQDYLYYINTCVDPDICTEGWHYTRTSPNTGTTVPLGLNIYSNLSDFELADLDNDGDEDLLVLVNLGNGLSEIYFHENLTFDSNIACSYTLTLTTQTEVDNFSTNYPNCNAVYPGLLRISSPQNTGDNITNLNGLSQLTQISALEIINNGSLENLEGLNNLETIDHDLIIEQNSDLLSLNGLNNLSSVGGHVIIGEGRSSYHDKETPFDDGLYDYVRERGNDDLENITALSNLIFIGGNLTVGANVNLQSLNGLNGLTDFNGSIKIFLNDILENLDGLNNLSSVGGNLIIGDMGLRTQPSWAFDFTNGNSSMETLLGLENLISVAGNLEILGNTNLYNLNGLNNLQTVGGTLEISACFDLPNLIGLDNLTTVGILQIGSSYLSTEFGENSGNLSLTELSGIDNLMSMDNFSVSSNPILENCSYPPICYHFINNGDGGIDAWNSTVVGCNSIAEILSNCSFECNSSFDLTSQEDVDNFPINFPNCDVVQGNLTIKQAADATPITDLSPLNQIIGVLGNLKIEQTDQLNNLNGLQNLIHVGLDLRIRNTTNLISINAFSKLGHIGEGINISDNTDLISLQGLEGITRLETYLEISTNPNLNSLVGLKNLSRISGNCLLNNNHSLTDFSGLEELHTIGTYTTNGNSNPTGNLYIEENDNLESLNFQKLKSIHGELLIRFNDQLTSLAGLERVSGSVLNFVRVIGNPQLSLCAYSPICYRFDEDESVISGNAAGCNNKVEVEEACDGCRVRSYYGEGNFYNTFTSEAIEQIESLRTIHNGAERTLRAGECILLSPGFEVKSGGILEVEIGDCEN